jgi:alkylresorcinol/alkylpyrone synthase
MTIEPVTLGSVADLIGLACVNPPFEVTQADGLAFAAEHIPMPEATFDLYRRFVDSAGISTRQFGVGQLRDVLDTDHDRTIARYQEWAVALSSDALHAALADAGRVAHDLDYLAITTCTGYLCPGLTSYVAERCGLRPDARRLDIVGMGCGAAIPAIEQASQFLAAHPGATAAVVSTEICSAAIFMGDAPDLIVSNSIFGDGSAAVVLRAPARDAGRNRDTARPDGRRLPKLVGFRSLLVPEWREGLRFRTEGGRLRNVLSREVPARAGEACRRLSADLLAEHGLPAEAVTHWVIHSGGRTVIDAVQSALSLEEAHVASARSVLRQHGNMSSPTVLFTLDEELRSRAPRPGELGVLLAFGAGFAAHAALVRF